MVENPPFNAGKQVRFLVGQVLIRSHMLRGNSTVDPGLSRGDSTAPLQSPQVTTKMPYGLRQDLMQPKNK